jgi:Flp pilus assembly protein TadG
MKRGRVREESGQSTIELAGMMFWLLLAAMFAWQLALVGWTAVSAGNAARSAARLVSRGDSTSDASQQALNGLAGRGLSSAKITFDGTTSTNASATARVQIPIVLPGLTPLNMWIHEGASMPVTG